MHRLGETLDGLSRFLVQDFGLLGLFAIAFLDSSFLSLPEVNDLLVVTLTLQDPENFWVYALTAATGSLLGCLTLHAIGKHGGQAVLRRRLSPARLERLQARFRRFDLFAVLVPSLLPPPCPFKVFVLASGVFGMSWPRFALTILVGRSVRYLGTAWLAVRFGRTILTSLGEYGYELALLGLLALLVTVLLRRLLNRPRSRWTPKPTA